MRGLGDHLSIGERIAFYRKRRGYTQEILAGLVGRSTDWLAKIETGRRKPPRIDMLTELSRILRVPLGDLLGQTVLVEDDKQQDDVPAVRDALMSPRRLSRLLFGPEAEVQLPTPAPVAVRVEHAWNDYQGGRLGSVITALPALLQTAQELEERAARHGEDRGECWAVSARTHHLAATTLAKIGESDISWLAAERAMRAADESDDPLVLASAARSGTHALLANGRYDDTLELGNTAAAWLSSRVTENDPAALSLLGMIHLRAAVAAARHQDRPTATGLLDRAEELADALGSDENYWQTGFGPTNVLLHRLSVAMATVTPTFVKDTKGMPDARAVRTALYSWAFNKNRWAEEPPADVAKVLEWFERKSLATSALSDLVLVRSSLRAISKRLDGTTAAAGTISRKRAIFYNSLEFAVEAELLTDNPLTRIKWKAPEQVVEEVDPVCVPNPEQASKLLAAVRDQSPRGRRLAAFFGCMYFAAARPAEVIALRLRDCDLPRRGWGLLKLRETRPRSGAAWTDSGESHDRRGLKHRPRKAVRHVPIPPELVALLRWHVTAYGTAPDDRLFRTSRGGLIQDTGYGEVWAEARTRALTTQEFESTLAKRPYDLRHAAVSTWLSSGVEPQLVAERAGHSVGVLFRV